MYTGWSKKNARLRSMISIKWGTKQTSCVHYFVYNSFSSNITPRSLILILGPFFWGNVIFKICHLGLKSRNDVPNNFHCLASPGKVSALALKNEFSMNKEKHSLRNSAVLQSGEGTQRNSSLPQSWLLIQKKQILKMTLLQINGSRIKTWS